MTALELALAEKTKETLSNQRRIQQLEEGSFTSEDYHKYNMDLLRDNARLRQNVEKMTSKLKSLMGHEFTLWSTCLSPEYTPGPATQKLHEVERILNLGKTNPTTVNKIDQGVQCDPDATVSALQLEVLELSDQLRLHQEELSSEKKLNRELGSSLTEVKKEMESLELTFARISNDIQVAKAAERVAKQSTKEREKELEHFHRQNTDLVQQLKECERRLQQYQNAKRILTHMAQPPTGPVVVPRPSNEQLDPVGMVEYQWMVDRERFTMEIEVFKNQIERLESENRVLKLEMKERIANMHDSSDYALLVAKNSIAQDEARRNQEELRTRAACITMLEADVSRLESQNQVKTKSIKDLRQRLRALKDECDRKEAVIQEQRDRINDLEKTTNQLEGKIKMLK